MVVVAGSTTDASGKGRYAMVARKGGTTFLLAEQDAVELCEEARRGGEAAMVWEWTVSDER